MDDGARLHHPAWSTGRSRPIALLVVVLLALGSVPMTATPAHADRVYPTGCQTRVTSFGGTSWANTCYVGDNYQRTANLVLGLQRWLRGLDPYGSCSNLSNDGLWGPMTKGCVVAYQDYLDGVIYNGPAGRDGVVGPATWGYMQGDGALLYCSSTHCYYNTRSWGNSPIARRFGTNGKWSIQSRSYSSWVYWDIGGPN